MRNTETGTGRQTITKRGCEWQVKQNKTKETKKQKKPEKEFGKNNNSMFSNNEIAGAKSAILCVSDITHVCFC